MAWLRSLGALAAHMLSNPPNKVIEVSISSYSGRVVHCRDSQSVLLLYLPSKEPDSPYEVVLQRPVNESTSKLWSLYRCESLEAAELWFTRIIDKVPTLVSISKDNSLAFLQRVCDAITDHPSWNIAHIAVKLQLIECLSDPRVMDAFHLEDPIDGVSPLQLAIETENIKIVKLLLSAGAPVDHFDHDCNSVLHYAASTNKKILNLITELSSNTLNSKNAQGLTPLHLACLRDRRECVLALLEAGADVNISTEDQGSGGEPGLLGNSLQQFTGQFSNEDIKHGGTPLHWACSQEVIEALIEKKCDINVRNFHRRTALHMMILRGRFDCVVCLLSHGADTEIKDKDGNTPLRLAVNNWDVNSVKALIVFNADIHERNESGHTVRHGILCGHSPADDVLYVLHSVGVKRCSPGVRGCTAACNAVESYNGVAPPLLPTSESRDTIKLILEEATAPRNNTNQGRLLCLDGGGIRGLILVVVLIELEKAVGCPIVRCFDWIAGTSTGGILALAIAWGIPLQNCLEMYFKLKSSVFVGIRPYSREPLEKILIETFGESSTMADIRHPRIMVTATLADRQPVQLHLFRNYPSASDILEAPNSANIDVNPPALQKLWETARATGAAPTYFESAGSFIDGGLISNNPTLDAMTEIHEYNVALKAVGRPQECTPVSLVVSLGTGSMPVVDNEAALTLLQKGNIWVNVKGFGNLINMLVDQATQADGRVVDRARAWCSSIGVPYYRLSPMLSKEVALNETQNKELIHMMWETRAYMHAKRADLADLITILKQPLLTNQPAN